jgi:hypothetical protein
MRKAKNECEEERYPQDLGTIQISVQGYTAKCVALYTFRLIFRYLHYARCTVSKDLGMMKLKKKRVAVAATLFAGECG